jgi:hypothetical protein
VITAGEKSADVSETFGRVELAAVVNHEYAMPYENNLPIYVCGKPEAPLKEVWPEVKCYSCRIRHQSGCARGAELKARSTSDT